MSITCLSQRMNSTKLRARVCISNVSLKISILIVESVYFLIFIIFLKNFKPANYFSLKIFSTGGVQEDNSNVFIDLVSQILSEPCYNVLRTQEQLGYIVFSGVRKANGAKGLRILVQSTKHPEYVEARIDKFLASMIVRIFFF